MKRAFTLIEALILLGILAIAAAILFPTTNKSRHNARRATCQANLYQFGVAMHLYAADYNDHLPPRAWAAPFTAYIKTDKIFQCPETNETAGTSDYFFNARFPKKPLSPIKSPTTLILFGDGQDDAPLDATLAELPTAWRTDENSPSFRHLGMANYLFADGHVKAIKANRVSRDFRMVLK